MATKPNQDKQQILHIAVVGGGYTGMVAALRLAEAGHKVSILERGAVLGGLASDFKVEGASLERAYHHLFKTDSHIRQMAQELGLEDKLEWHDSAQALYYGGTLYPFKGALDLLRFKPLRFVNRIRAGIVVLYLQKLTAWQPLQRQTAYDWMRKAAGQQVLEVIWEPLLKGKFDHFYDKVSMAWLWARIHIRAQSREAGGEKLGYFKGGFQIFSDALIDRLTELGVDIQTEVVIKSIENNEKGAVLVDLQDGSQRSYDRLVSTTPSHVFAGLIERSGSIEPGYLEQLRSIDYLGARLLIFSSSQSISDYYWHNINDLDLPFLVFIHHTKLIDPAAYNNHYIYYIATYTRHDSPLFTMDDDELEEQWFTGLQQIFPDFDCAQVREKHFFRFANAQHIVTTDYAAKIPAYQTPLAHVYLANFSQIYPEDRGTNYAVREGEAIARLILTDQAGLE